MTINHPPCAFTRREFVQAGLTIVSTVTTVPAFLTRSAYAINDPNDMPLVRNRPGIPDDHILVVVQLSGGNDGLNTVVPFGARNYYNSRPQLAIRENDALKLDDVRGIGLHPNMSSLKGMLDDGIANVVMGVGYPNPNRSHFASMDIWHSGDTLGNRGEGWLGKAIDQHNASLTRPDPLACICLGKESPLAANGKASRPITFERISQLQWAGADLHPVLAEQYDDINRAGVLADGNVDQSQAAFVMRTALDAQIAPKRIEKALGTRPLTAFPGGQLANQLRTVAAMIRAELPTRVYYVALGGFDNHANQANLHGNLLRQFADGVAAFYKELAAMGHDKRVLTMAFSEFGRRVTQNAAHGTDHGTAGPMFLFGDMVNPGMLGKYPSLTKLDKDDLIYNLDFRSVYTAILQDWMKVDAKTVLGKPFKPANVLRV
jgi:uncharacterized protein (DUF1501 family)